MFSVYKYKYLEDMKIRHKNTFELCQNETLEILPPILKKIGAFYYLAFMVVESPAKTQEKNISKPVAVKTKKSNQDQNSR